VVRSADKLKLAKTDSLDDVERQILSSFHKHATWGCTTEVKSRESQGFIRSPRERLAYC
jgi:hypothetical protein